MKMIALLVALCVISLTYANSNDQTQIEKYGGKYKTYQLDVPGKEPITIIETGAAVEDRNKWEDVSVDISKDKDDVELKNLMTHIIHNVNENNPRCYGPSCQEGYNDRGPHEGYEGYLEDNHDKLKDYRDLTSDRLLAITALAAKLKKEKLKADRYPSVHHDEDEEDENGKVFTSWNRLKVKQHKHPFDDKDGWVTLEPVAWSTSKISKWKPNVKKQKPNHWTDDNDKFPDEDRFTSTNYEGSNDYIYPQKKPSLTRPGYINNKLHIPADFESELPSKPSWTKPQMVSNTFSSSWSPDEGRRPHKPNCDSDQTYPGDATIFYGMSDSLVTDTRPSNFPYEYEALHQASTIKRPFRRPTQVVYAGSPDMDGDRASKPPYGDGQWVLLSTTKGYRNKKRQRSLSPTVNEQLDFPTVTSHQAVALTVLPVDNAHTNMTTSHGGLLEVEKSFQTVEESKRDMDKKYDLEAAATNFKPVKNKIIKRKLVSSASPDSSTVLAAVGAGMLPATMAMVVPMMLGRRRRRRDVSNILPHSAFDNIIHRYQRELRI